MKTNKLFTFGLLAFFALAIGVSSCKKDDEPPPAKPKLSFTTPSVTVNEADGTVEVEFTLDKPATEDIVVEYSLSGTAIDKASVAANQAFDYEVLTDPGEVEILQGETTGIIEIKMYSDLRLEEAETIEVQIDDVDSENIELTREDEYAITVEQEDGLVIALNWPAPAAGAQADMDLLLWVGDNTTTWEGVLTGSTQESFASPEAIFIPNVLPYAAYGLSYVYYDGTLDPLEFTVTFIEFISGDFEDEAQAQEFTATYTAANKNKWTDANSTIVAQTFGKSATGFSEVSSITVPVSSSRVRPTVKQPSNFQKGSPMMVETTLLGKLK
jgi:hypothetical protein